MDIWTVLASYSFFETERVYLRPFTFLDSSVFYSLVSDPSQITFLFPTVSSQSESDYLLTHSFLKKPLGVWAISDKSSHTLLGFIKLEKIDTQKKEAELAYFLDNHYRCQGMMTEVVKNIVFLAFKELGLKSLIILTHLENQASQKVAEKAGFTFIEQFKGSDRYTRKMRYYKKYQLNIGDYHE